VDWRAYPPVLLAIGPVPHPIDAAANKLCALFGRAGVRDYIDVYGVLKDGRYTGPELLQMAAEHDPGFASMMFAEALRAVTRLPASAFEPYKMAADQVEAMYVRLLAWAEEIEAGNSYAQSICTDKSVLGSFHGCPRALVAGQEPRVSESAGCVGTLGGIVGGMRRKTSLTLDETTIATARIGAKLDGKPLSQWVEQAILNEAGRTDVRLIEEWESALSSGDQAVLAAFADSDRLADLDK
jgi:hypothetical protein